ncbi:hypothetical protein OCQ_25050 [Mycobacterium paraintracellulare]|nr:hypothetical protein OCQ_25050 [Mycobacterium paraintracellulare]OSC25490.1 hypothetical protein B8W68_13855 [Mycobacterium paraintracellulare]
MIECDRGLTGIYRVSPSNVDWDADASRFRIAFTSQFRHPGTRAATIGEYPLGVRLTEPPQKSPAGGGLRCARRRKPLRPRDRHSARPIDPDALSADGQRECVSRRRPSESGIGCTGTPELCAYPMRTARRPHPINPIGIIGVSRGDVDRRRPVCADRVGSVEASR